MRHQTTRRGGIGGRLDQLEVLQVSRSANPADRINNFNLRSVDIPWIVVGHESGVDAQSANVLDDCYYNHKSRPAPPKRWFIYVFAHPKNHALGGAGRWI